MPHYEYHLPDGSHLYVIVQRAWCALCRQVTDAELIPTLAETERYTEEADQAGLAEDAVIKLEGHKANRIAQTTSAGLGNTEQKIGKSK